MTDVFVSYARVDKPRVEKLAHALEARGFDIWWDHELIAGERYSEMIAQHLDRAKAVIVVWSAASIGSEWVCDEANVGKDRGVLVPVMFERVDPPLGYRQFQSENLAGWPDEAAGQAAFERLVAALSRLRGKDAPAGVSAERKPAPAPALRPFLSGGLKGPMPYALGAALLAGAALFAFTLPRPASSPPVVDPPVEQPLQMGPNQRYGFTDSDIAALSPEALATTALERSDLDTVEAAAAERDALSLSILCVARARGVGGVQADRVVAERTCADAKARGATIGGYMLSVLAREGDPARADALLEEAVIAGDPRAQHDRAESLLDAQTDLRRARSLADTCAARGNVECRFLAASLQAQGVGGPRDVASARAALQKLVDPPFFHAGAARELGLLLIAGVDGAPPDLETGLPLLQRAQVLRDGRASFELGRLSEAGTGVPQSLEAALKHYEQAVADGYAGAQTEVDRLRGM